MKSEARHEVRKLRWGRALLAIWLVLLVASHLVWRLERGPREHGPSELITQLSAVDGDQLRPELAFMAYSDLGARPGQARATLLLIHGSPGSGRDFTQLSSYLPQDLRLLVPDLPGFGDSQRTIPDYSAQAHARYLLQWLEKLGIERVHLVGFSMGGAVALELTQLAPERVASLSMVSALGALEFELFGDHQLNHLVHGLQLRTIQLLRALLPHFGSADDWVLGLPYARNFYDTDQRRMRPALEGYLGPALIVHGERDFLVPLAAARESRRLMPQSELVVLDASHFVLWTKPQVIAQELAEFIARSESGEALTRAEASPAALARATELFDPTSVPPAAGPALLLLIALLIVGTFVSEDLTCIAAGLMVAQGRITFGPALFGCTAGIFLGDVGLFLLGRWFGRPIVERAPVRWFLSSAALDRASGWFERQGPRAIFLSRFMPGLRLPTYFAAGVLRTSFLKFTAYFLLAVLLWTPLLVGFAVVFGKRAIELIDRWGVPALVFAVLTMLFIERVLLRLFTFRGRRALLGAWKRWTQWQHWPQVLFYPPIAVYVAWLAVRHRSLLGVTAVNPGIPTGGLIGESKSEILDALDHSTGLIARYRLLRARGDADARVSAALEFADGEYPLIFKPEVGQRGSGVVVVKSAHELAELVRNLRVDHIVQEYVSGPEYGIFYLREPGAQHGRLYSIAEKRLPSVFGDGEHTLERLILSDEHLVAAAPHYLRAQAARLQEIPARGERVQLVELGTHSRGAEFLNGAHLATPELEASIEKLSQSFGGFHFGRFDVRAESEQALRQGRSFKVLELNGMTSEAAHIYDPSTSLREAYRVLCEQWRLAFEIASANRAAGARPSTWREVLCELLGYRKQQRSHHT